MFAGESKVINLIPGHRNWKRLGENHLYPLQTTVKERNVLAKKREVSKTDVYVLY